MGRRTLWALIAAMALIVVGASSARAAHRHPWRAEHHRSSQPQWLYLDPIALVKERARTYWRDQAPCGGAYTVRLAALAPPTAAQATWRSPAGLNVFGDTSLYTGCAIVLSSASYPNVEAMEMNFIAFCAIFVHEYGHLLGFHHSTDPSNIMYPQPRPPAICRQSTTFADGIVAGS